MADNGGAAINTTWTPSRYALWSQRWGGADEDDATAVLLRHPTAPFPDVPAIFAKDDDTAIKRLSYEYLKQINALAQIDPPLELPPSWVALLDPDHPPAHPNFAWLPIAWPPADLNADSAGNPYVSFRVDRKTDQTIVLLASHLFGFFDDESKRFFLGSEFGIRIVAQARPVARNKISIRITGMTASIPVGDVTPSIIRLRHGDEFSLFAQRLAGLQVRIANVLGAEADSVQIRGLRPTPNEVTLRATASIKAGGNKTPYSTVTAFSNLGLVSKVELVADGRAPIPGYSRLFPRDPASQPDIATGHVGNIHQRRPSRSEQTLDNYREGTKVADDVHGLLVFPPRHEHDDDEMDELRVLACPRFVPEDRVHGNPQDIKEVELPDTGPDKPYIRSNDFSAISAFNNIKQLFQRLEAYGINNSTVSGRPVYPYFRLARLPLKVLYRSGIRPGPGKDGQTINARVIGEGWPVNLVAPTKLHERPRVEMHLALADLSMRARKAWKGERIPVEPLGIAADARWIWHEIGHVLLMASVGELEFRFAHSAGDALAAIVADPQSILASNARWRGATFPWVFEPRRHDRCACNGWSWDGLLHYAAAHAPNSQPARRKGYQTEQILSSSLFRLYRCIGGDTTIVASELPYLKDRESASHYSVYLIMRGIQILGASDIVPTYKADQFVSALIDADIGTEVWDVKFPPPPEAARYSFLRVGGCLHKVIRWAFEAQGMYTHSRAITNERGEPPAVDVFIGDRRPIAENGVVYGEGSYVPVSLDWNRNQRYRDKRTPPPSWQATDAAIHMEGGNLYVVVGNRGSQSADNVTVTVSWHRWPDDEDPPKWNDGDWKSFEPKNGLVQTIPAGQSERFGPFSVSEQLAGTRFIVVAHATCADDRANTDAAAHLPCNLHPTPLVDLVANDNNLGLAVFE